MADKLFAPNADERGAIRSAIREACLWLIDLGYTTNGAVTLLVVLLVRVAVTGKVSRSQLIDYLGTTYDATEREWQRHRDPNRIIIPGE